MVTVDKSEGPRNGEGMEQHTCKVMGESQRGEGKTGVGEREGERKMGMLPSP